MVTIPAIAAGKPSRASEGPVITSPTPSYVREDVTHTGVRSIRCYLRLIDFASETDGGIGLQCPHARGSGVLMNAVYVSFQ